MRPGRSEVDGCYQGEEPLVTLDCLLWVKGGGPSNVQQRSGQNCGYSTTLFGEREQRRGNIEAERLRCLQVDERAGRDSNAMACDTARRH
jgi:hypothetical protein